MLVYVGKMTKKLTELLNTRSVINILGGEAAVADMIGVTPKAANNWANWNLIPKGYYARMMFDINELGYTAAPELWGQIGCKSLRIRRVSK